MAASANTPRPSRFIDTQFELISPGNDYSGEISGVLANFKSLFQQEKDADSVYKSAWDEAERQCDPVLGNMNEKDKNFIAQQLANKLPEQLKDNPKYLVIAVIANCMEKSEFAEKFQRETRALHSGSTGWPSFGLKTFFTLLSLAQKHLPSRPGPLRKRMTFRGLDTDADMKVDQVFSLGYFASFTPSRRMALGRQPPLNKRKPGDLDDTEEEMEDDDNEDESPSDGHKFPKKLLRVLFDDQLKGLGTRQLSPFGRREIEVIVRPEQKFRVHKILERKKKGFSVLVLRPID